MLEGFLLWTWLLLPGCRALTGPAEASGPVGGTVVVTCTYEPEQAETEKYWCRGSSWLFCSVHVATAGAEARAERLQLRDERARHAFVVTMQNLTESDGDTYWCGIRLPLYDAMARVVVTVLPAPHTTDPHVYTMWGDPRIPTAVPHTTDPHVYTTQADPHIPITVPHTTDPHVYTTRGDELTPAASSPSRPPELASTMDALNSSSPWASVPSVTVLALMPPVVLVLSIVVGLRLRRASRGRSSAAKDTGKMGHKDRQVRQDGAAAHPNLYANAAQELSSPEGDYENSPTARQDLAKRREVSSSSRNSSAVDAQPIYMNMPRSGPRGPKAQRDGRGIR